MNEDPRRVGLIVYEALPMTFVLSGERHRAASIALVQVVVTEIIENPKQLERLFEFVFEPRVDGVGPTTIGVVATRPGEALQHAMVEVSKMEPNRLLFRTWEQALEASSAIVRNLMEAGGSQEGVAANIAPFGS